MNTASITYLGELRTQATHIRSGRQIITDAPVDNHGKGEAFSPTDLVSSALVSCMMTVIGIMAQTHQIDVSGMEGEVLKVMGTDPRRISELKVLLRFPRDYKEHDRVLIERTARTCPVAKSLHPDLGQDIQFSYAHGR
ncbi:MAG: osmotically inducible protein OsmC [Sphingobacteriaceae bacterium]|nr:osmotically inducible protein OsmC [Sphingobacteriaceae bacterium]